MKTTIKKITIAVAILMSSLCVNSQTNNDSLNKRIIILEQNSYFQKKEITNIQLNLERCHFQYKFGLGIVITGGLISIGGSLLFNKETKTGTPINQGIGVPVIVMGGITSLIGSIIIIDSHKFIGRAGLNGITINF